MRRFLLRVVSVIAIGLGSQLLVPEAQASPLVALDGCTAVCPAQAGCVLCDTQCRKMDGGWTLSICLYKCDGSVCGPNDVLPET